MKPINNHLGFGGAALTSMKSYKEVKQLLNVAFEQGIRHFDTAVLYGKGYSELILGSFLKNKRADVTITSKFGLGQPVELGSMPVQLLLPLNYHLKRLKKAIGKAPLMNSEPVYKPVAYRIITKKQIETSFNGSLSRLKTDYLDYYLIHEGLPRFLTDEAFEFLLGLKKQGRVRAIGIGSNVLDIKTLYPNEVKDWDVLQYEGHLPAETAEIMQKFPDKTHFHHSCLKNRDNIAFNDRTIGDKVGFMLAQAAHLNPHGKVIFSTRSEKHLINNVNSFIKGTSIEPAARTMW